MIKFNYEVPESEEKYTATRSLDMTIDSEQPVYDIIEAFSEFLKASGYMFKGRIELISEEEAETEDQIILKQLLDALSDDVKALRADT
tara:strand:+ start:966 stop:1229 length:264 start_codon:yes stop_codon:yes gene_type:complete